VIIPIYQMQFL